MARAGLKYLEAEAAPAEAQVAERPGLKYLADEEEEPGRLEALLRGLKQGATLGFGDELTGLAESAFSDKTYKQARDEARANDAAAREAHGGYFAGGELGGGLATALIPGALGARAAGAGLRGAAALGAAYGAGESTADLTEGDVGGLARDVAVGAGAGALAHGAVGLVGKGLRAGEKYLSGAVASALEGEAGSAAKGVAGSKLGRAAAGAAAGAYADDDAVEGAIKGTAAGLAGPALYRGVKGVGKAAIVAALKRRVAAAAERIASRAGPAAEWEAVPAAAEAVERATAAPVTRETALARVVKATRAGELTPELVDQAQAAGVPEHTLARLQGVSEKLAIAPDGYIPPGAARALEGEPERLALGPVPEAPGRGAPLGPGPEGEASTAAIPLPPAKPLDEAYAAVAKHGGDPELAQKAINDLRWSSHGEDAQHIRGAIVGPGGNLDAEAQAVLAARADDPAAVLERLNAGAGDTQLRKTLKAMAKVSQDAHANDGEMLTLYRGVSKAQAAAIKRGRMPSGALASFTDDPATARTLGDVVVESRVPRKNIVLSYRAFGDDGETLLPGLYREEREVTVKTTGSVRARVVPGDAPAAEPPPAPAPAPAEAGPATAATADAVAEFRDAVAKANRLAASGDKMRAQLWLKDAEKKFKAAMAGAQR